jgi:predicted membrane metal-binding protein
MNLYHLDKLGLGGTLVTLACCLGFGPILAVLSAIGAGFLINDTILAPLLIGFLILGGVGLASSRRRHHRWGPLGIHVGSAVVMLAFTFLAYFQPLIWLGVAGLLTASVWDFVLRRRCHTANNETCEPASDAQTP